MRRAAIRILVMTTVLAGALRAGGLASAQNASSQNEASPRAGGDAKSANAAREGKKKPNTAATTAATRKPQPAEIKLKPEQEAVALAFARAHHAELADLLDQLKQNSAAEYGKALQDLFRAADRLSKLHDRDADRYPLELDLWKIESRIRLLTAQLLMGGSVSLEADLKGLVVQRIELRSRLLQMDRDRAAQRITQIDRELETLRADPEGAALRELDRLKKNAARTSRPAGEKGTGATAKSKQEKDKKRGTDVKPDSQKQQ